MSGLCGDCHHWQHKEEHDFGVCQRAEHVPSKALCGTSLASTLHGHEEDTYFRGSLLTQADFGCVQFEAKDT